MFWRNSVRKIGPLSCVGILRARSSTQKSHYFLCCVQRDPSFGQGRLGKSSQECFFIWRTHEVFPEPPSSLRVFLFVVRKIGSGDHPRGGGRHRGCIILRTTSSQRQRFLIIRVRNAHPMDSQRKTLFPFFFYTTPAVCIHTITKGVRTGVDCRKICAYQEADNTVYKSRVHEKKKKKKGKKHISKLAHHARSV